MANENAGATEKTEKNKTPQEVLKEETNTKQPWTVQRCLKAARRFEAVADWQNGAPSSYKAAVAHGWLKECTAHMTTKSLPAKAPATKKTSQRPAVKKSA